MKKATLACLKQDEEFMLRSLQKCGEMMLLSDSQANDTPVDSQRAEELMKALRRYQGKKSMFAPRKEIDSETFFSEDAGGEVLAQNTQETTEAFRQCQNEAVQLNARINQLEPWISLDVDADQLVPTPNTAVFTGCVPLAAQGAVEAAAEEFGAELHQYGNTPDGVASVLFYFREDESLLRDRLQEAGFMHVALPCKSGSIQYAYQQAKQQLESVQAELDRLDEKLKMLSKQGGELELYSDRLRTAEIRRKAPVLQTLETVIMEGWVRSDRMEKVKKAVADVTDIYSLSFEDPKEEEKPPTVTKNNWFTTAFEAITDMFSRPSTGELDPNPVMASAYWIIFGLMMGDAGYGLLMVLLLAIFKRLKKPRGIMEKIINILLYSGVTTTVFGVLFGSYFGETWNPILLAPIEDPLSMLLLSLGVGVLHIFAGMIIAIANNIRKGKFWDAVFDQISWMILIIGLGLLFLPALSTVGMALAVVGALIVLCTAGRSKDGIFRKITGGLMGLYNISGYLSDILSYSRILALSLSTGVVGMVMNLLARMVQGSAVGFVLSLAIYAVGHLFNLAMGLLSAYVHDSRLQYIEFFNKFYEGGGTAFVPLTVATKYVDVKNNDSSGGK
ncbi:MAG: V-type ATP synthase subunit I [Christensenellales bacterium]